MKWFGELAKISLFLLLTFFLKYDISLMASLKIIYQFCYLDIGK